MSEANHPPGSWYAATAGTLPDAPPLDGDCRADACIIGGGYTGLAAALRLAQAGRKVVLLEQARLGWGASGRNGGQVHFGFRWDQPDLERALGEEPAHAIWRVCLDAHAHLLALLGSIDCDWQPGLLHLDHRARAVPASHRLCEHMVRRYGYDGFTPLDAAQTRDLVASGAYHGGLRSRDGGHLHPLRFALGLARMAQAAGARLCEQSPALAVEKADGLWQVRTARGTVLASDLLIAGNGYLRGLDQRIERHVMPINNFIAVTEPLPDPAALIKERLAVADSRFVVYYFRITRDNRLLFGGGENYSYRFPGDIAGTVRRHLRRVFPQLGDVPISHAWGGTLAVTPSRLPFVRRLEPGLYTAAGYSGQGVLLAPYFGTLAAEAMLGESAGFDLLSRLPVPAFPGGTLLRWPILVSAMLALRLRDML